MLNILVSNGQHGFVPGIDCCVGKGTYIYTNSFIFQACSFFIYTALINNPTYLSKASTNFFMLSVHASVVKTKFKSTDAISVVISCDITSLLSSISKYNVFNTSSCFLAAANNFKVLLSAAFFSSVMVVNGSRRANNCSTCFASRLLFSWQCPMKLL